MEVVTRTIDASMNKWLQVSIVHASYYGTRPSNSEQVQVSSYSYRAGLGFKIKNPPRVRGGLVLVRIGFGNGQTHPILDPLPSLAP